MKGIWSIAAIAALGLTATTAQAEEPQEVTNDYPRGIYIEVDPVDAVAAETPVQHGGAAHILYLQRCEGGLQITPGGGGSVSNESQIINGVINLPPYPFGDNSWNQVVDITRDIFSPFNILVTDVDPSPMPHDEAVVCGAAGDAGFPQGVGGVAPFSCGVIANAITFTFPEALGSNPQLIAEVIGQEAAHAWGLEHEYLCEDPMTYLPPCGPKTFQDIDAQCGEYNPRPCDCGGNTQNSYQEIMAIFGPNMPDAQAPTASITYPSDGDVFEPGAAFDITVNVDDNVQVDQVSLFVDGSLEGTDGSEPFGPWPVTNIPEGVYSFHIEATDVAGNVTVSSSVTISVNTTGEPPPPDPTAGDEGGGEGGENGDSGDDGGLDGGDDRGDGDGDGDGGRGGGALPEGYGSGFGPTQQGGCTCRTGDGERGGWAFGLAMLGLLGLRVQGRRRRRR